MFEKIQTRVALSTDGYKIIGKDRIASICENWSRTLATPSAMRLQSGWNP